MADENGVVGVGGQQPFVLFNDNNNVANLETSSNISQLQPYCNASGKGTLWIDEVYKYQYTIPGVDGGPDQVVETTSENGAPLTFTVVGGEVFALQLIDVDMLPNPNDYAAGGGGRDFLNGGEGNDVLFGGYGISCEVPEHLVPACCDGIIVVDDFSADTLLGGNGNDSLFGEKGNDILNGGADDDYLDGGIGNDRLIGEAGNDVLLGNVGVDYLDGGAGRDTMCGGDGNDQMYGGAQGDTMGGACGDDYMEGGNENPNIEFPGGDVMLGGTGNDTMLGQDGNDTMVGGTGNDVINGGADNDQIQGDGCDPTGSECCDCDDCTDALVYNDTIDGGTGNDSIWGMQGNDSLLGGEGNDQIDGGSGDDFISGGNGNDILWGDTGADSMWGGAGTDTMCGGEGADTMRGLADDDLVLGNAGNDKLFGDTGNDTLVGGTGNDTLTGGAGDDLFVYTADFGAGAGDGYDVIIGFQRGPDTYNGGGKVDDGPAGPVGDGDVLCLNVLPYTSFGELDYGDGESGDIPVHVVDDGFNTYIYFDFDQQDEAIKLVGVTGEALDCGRFLTLDDMLCAGYDIRLNCGPVECPPEPVEPGCPIQV